jgi:hypothetical protein
MTTLAPLPSMDGVDAVHPASFGTCLAPRPASLDCLAVSQIHPAPSRAARRQPRHRLVFAHLRGPRPRRAHQPTPNCP